VLAEDAGRTFIGRLRLAARRIGLPAWFVAVDLLWVAKLDPLAADARIYQVAARVWLSGGDPWATPGLQFAAGPHVLLLYAPTTLLSREASVVTWMLLGLGAAAWLVNRLGAPWWWLGFPPLFHAVWVGNPQTIALALLVSGGALAATVAVAFKYYALVPLLAKPRVLATVIAGLALVMPFLPVERYLADGLGLSQHVATAWDGSAARLPILLPLVVAALFVLRRSGAEWLAVPAVWPATQFYYVAMAMPAIVGRPLLAAALALPATLMVPAVVLGLAAIRLRERSRGVLRSA